MSNKYPIYYKKGEIYTFDKNEMVIVLEDKKVTRSFHSVTIDEDREDLVSCESITYPDILNKGKELTHHHTRMKHYLGNYDDLVGILYGVELDKL